jgi:two-component system cell cycle sensor histidine kinase/response regulator CckA
MKPRMAKEDVSDRTAGERRGSIGLVLLVAVVLVAAAVGLMFVGRNQAEPYVLALLAILGMIGVFSLFAAAAGILRVARRDSGSPILKAVVDGAGDGIVVTDPSGRVIYANAAYLKLADAVGTDDVRPVERVFLGDPEVSEAIYRLVKAAREGRSLQEEVRVAGLRGEPARWLRLRVRPLGEGGREARTTVWSVADVTRDRDRHETAFQGLQYAIDYLDHAPAGFFSVDESGHIGYLNATLAGWLDHDLAQIGSGGLRLTDIVPGDSAALLTTLSADPGEVKTEVLDLDLRPGAARPCRCASITRSHSEPTARRAPRAPSCSTVRATTAPTRNARPKCASCASSTTRRSRSRPSTRAAVSRAPMRSAPACSSAF